MAQSKGRSGPAELATGDQTETVRIPLRACKFAGRVPEPGRVEGGVEYVSAEAAGNELFLCTEPVPHVRWLRTVRGCVVSKHIPLGQVLCYELL